VGVAALVLVAIGVYLARSKPAPSVTTATVVRKTLAALVTATGTVNPQDTISVGAQVSGTIEEIDADFNDPVRAGQILARLDPTPFQASFDQANASLAQAQAQWEAAQANASGASSNAAAANASAAASAEGVRVAEAAVTSADAEVTKNQAALTLAKQTLARDRTLLDSGYIAQSQYDADSSAEIAAESALSSAVVSASQTRIQLSVAQNQAKAGGASSAASSAQAIGSTKTAAANLAAIRAAQATVRQAQLNLNHTVITSPVNGTIIARNVSIGQTVAASFQTPTLYTIAKDLTKMEVDIAVGEPDVGSLRVGQPVTFTVLAFPSTLFRGTVAQVRINPTTIQNVVTYDTVIYENNASGLLKPGMTANASIQTALVNDALVVPLAALSFRPQARAPQPHPSGSAHPSNQSEWGNTGTAATTSLNPGSLGQVTVVDNGTFRTVPVRLRLISGGEAAIEPLDGKTLATGDLVATATSQGASAVVQRAPGMFR
jgi:HlyD family secretion protein